MNKDLEQNLGVGRESAANFRVPATGNPDLDDIALTEGAELVEVDVIDDVQVDTEPKIPNDLVFVHRDIHNLGTKIVLSEEGEGLGIWEEKGPDIVHRKNTVLARRRRIKSGNSNFSVQFRAAKRNWVRRVSKLIRYLKPRKPSFGEGASVPIEGRRLNPGEASFVKDSKLDDLGPTPRE